ncbi:helix-turn-helix domain-containing protein [Lactobacillus parabuchneri]|jgi:transcriptional regulator with XRE-family HTH domain|uniref:Helix-turn-helix domain-containing protein n=1 Tax=Lentilactobacillus parabuchneri TaxID=152331 RepID=A0A844EK41_9LACO|nr:helix-turn-helix domain-containing protein [Lentilactobacillus parabuchneri]
MTVFDRIKKVADKRGLSLREVAKKAGMRSETAIYRYNQGVTPRNSTLIAISEVLNVSVGYLKGETDDDSQIRDKPTVDLNKDDAILTFDGKPIPEEDMELIKRLLGK